MATEPMNEHDPNDEPGHDALLDLLSYSAHRLVADPDPQRFIADLAEVGPMMFPDVLRGDPAVWREHRAKPAGERAADEARLFRSLAWAVASAIPLPGQRFRARRLPLPGRNDPCLCGSLLKFKHCCAERIGMMPRFDEDLLGALVVEALPREQWGGLHAAGARPEMVAAAAEELRDDERLADAVRLLEPWSKLPPPWPDDRAGLLDLLGDCYLDQQKPRKRKQLAEAMVAHGAPAVQAKGWHRLAMLAADRGDAAASQAAFEKAQRLAPDDPALAMLEVTLLYGRGEAARARERAAFHARRLKRLPDAQRLEPAIDALEQLSREDSPLSGRVHAEFGPPDLSVFELLREMLADAPPPRLRLALPAQPVADLTELEPAPAARRPLTRWRKVFAVEPGRLALQPAEFDLPQLAGSSDWLALLHKEPQLIDCFEVLDDLLGVLDAVPFDMARPAADLVQQRALALWAQLRERQPGARCEWAYLGNRPALRLLARFALRDGTPTAAVSFDGLRHLVEVLNPHDNHGLRERLAAVLLRRGDTAGALALCERYPDDAIGMQLLHARTLLSLRRAEAAVPLLQQAVAHNPHLRPLLLGKRAPRLPHVPSYALGSIEEARIALAPQFDLWRSDPVVQRWLRDQLDPPAAAGTTGELFD